MVQQEAAHMVLTEGMVVEDGVEGEGVMEVPARVIGLTDPVAFYKSAS